MKRIFPLALIGAGMLTGSLPAAAVDLVYEGTITNEFGGLGLTGQTLRVTLSYNPAVTGSPSGSSTLYSGFTTALTVTIGTNTWTWNGAADSDFLFLNNNDLITFSSGLEDRFNLFAGDFSGPVLVNGSGNGVVEPFSYSLNVILTDNVPTGNPDGLATDTALPDPAPDPALFSNAAQPELNVIEFSWNEGDLELGTRYSVSATGLSAVTPEVEATPVPVPAPALIAIGALCAGIAGRRQRQGASNPR